MKNLIRWETRN